MTTTNIFCPRCGRETDARGRFCQWCGTDTSGESVEVPNEPGDDTKISWWWLVAFIALLAVIVMVIIVMGAPNTERVVNVTITEKYPASSAYGSSTPPKVVDQDGVLYIVEKEPLWEKLKLNETYQVTNEDQNRRKIDAVKIGDLWYL